MAKLIFTYTEDAKSLREASSVTLDVPDDMDITEYKIACGRLAAALGYSSKSIERQFGYD